jgi:hypothetical protein
MLRKKPTKEWEAKIKMVANKYETAVTGKTQEQVEVYLRCIYDRVVEIDTKGERFDADVIIESTWRNDQVLKILLMPQFSKSYYSMCLFA